MSILAEQNHGRPPEPATGTSCRSHNRNRGLRVTSFLLACCLLRVFFALQLSEACAQTISHEYPLKAVFLLNFARFTAWPTNAFASDDAPFVVGILGHSPFGSLIEQTVRGEKINHHKILLESYRNVGDITHCNMLFIAQSEAGQMPDIVKSFKTRPILTVTDLPDAAANGVCVQFVTENNKIRFRININALKEAHLSMSSELLRLAEIVSD